MSTYVDFRTQKSKGSSRPATASHLGISKDPLAGAGKLQRTSGQQCFGLELWSIFLASQKDMGLI